MPKGKYHRGLRVSQYLNVEETNRLLDNLELDPILEKSVREVRFLYHNSNKLKKVYPEPIVKAMIGKLQNKIKKLEKELEEKEMSAQNHEERAE